METEQKLAQHLENSKKAIDQAHSLIGLMQTLRNRLHLKQGCGQRFLQKTNPDSALLQKAEKEINEFYSGQSQKSKGHNTNGNNKDVLNNIARYGRA